MSAQADFGAEFVRRVILPAIDIADFRMDEDPEVKAGDLVAYLLHWAEAEGADALAVLAAAEMHWDAERGTGDDIAQGCDDYYRDLIKNLP